MAQRAIVLRFFMEAPTPEVGNWDTTVQFSMILIDTVTPSMRKIVKCMADINNNPASWSLAIRTAAANCGVNDHGFTSLTAANVYVPAFTNV